MASNVALSGLARDMARHAETARPIRIGLVGAGEMGTDIIAAVAHMEGLEVGAIAELSVDAATTAVATALGVDDRARTVSSDDALSRAMEAGHVAVTEDADMLVANGLIDVVIDATGVPAVGAEIGMRAMQHGKHLVMMNVEADVTIGALLKHEASRQGVVYTLGAGDEPSSCMELIEFVSAMGYPIVCAGKGKNNPLNVEATPDQYEAEARQRNMNARMLVEFVDGSKTMVEMAAIANATGLTPDRPGMHGPVATLTELSRTLVPQSAGGVLSAPGRVDYSVGKGVAPGVFVVADMSHARVSERMTDLKVIGNAPYFLFHRPYHLTSLEVPLSCARAVLYGKADMQPLDRPVAEVCAVAKRDIAAGETLDAIGEYGYRCWIMSASEARAAKAIPAGVLHGGKSTRAIAKGDLLTLDNAAPPADSRLMQLRARQDELVASLEDC